MKQRRMHAGLSQGIRIVQQRFHLPVQSWAAAPIRSPAEGEGEGRTLAESPARVIATPAPPPIA